MQAQDYQHHPLIRLLRNPEESRDFQATEWGRLLRAARRGQLLSHVAWKLEHIGLIDELPAKVQLHLLSALRVSESQARSINWEIHKIKEALADKQIAFIVLKGAAYIKAGHDAGQGRLMSDIDIMVRREQLTDAERVLCEHGWFPTKLDPYDQKYYREWMHELPPLLHLDRGTNLDVHHTILPPTASLKPNPQKLWQNALPVEGEEGVFVLDPIDMILHSAVHLFHDGDMEHGLRDLVDIDALLKQFSEATQFWEKLINRANELELIRPLYYALKYCRLFLATSIPEDAYTQAMHFGQPKGVGDSVMKLIVPRNIGAILKRESDPLTHVSGFLIYVRSHYLRMPLYLLLPHLLRKQLASRNGKK